MLSILDVCVANARTGTDQHGLKLDRVHQAVYDAARHGSHNYGGMVARRKGLEARYWDLGYDEQ